MENWNRNDYQGKHKDQVEYSEIIIFGCVVCGVILGIVVGVMKVCNVL